MHIQNMQYVPYCLHIIVLAYALSWYSIYVVVGGRRCGKGSVKEEAYGLIG